MAKEKGRNRVQVYHREDSELSMRQGEMEWIGRLQKALAEDRFVLYAQDIVGVDPARRHGTHCEILIRMLDERGELVPPMAFIPAAERYNLMPAIDRWVIRTAFATISRQRAEGGRFDFGVCAINLSGASIGDERFLEFLREQFVHFGVPPQTICFEITETAAIANLDKAAHFIRELKSLGCLFSLLLLPLCLLPIEFLCLLSSDLLSSGLLSAVRGCFFGFVVKLLLNFARQFIKIELGNSSLRAYDYSIRLYPSDGRVLKLFPIESFEVVGHSE